MPIRTCETSYPPELIARILAIRGPAWTCDDLQRDESPEYVEKELRYAILGYRDPGCFAGARILDFGCGSGGSTMVLARLLPNATIIGIDLEPEWVAVAEARARHHGHRDVSFRISPAADALPDGIGDFDAITLNAVYEHLLPHERRTLLPVLWKRLKPNGILFINQTPYRWFPLEMHSTGLPLVNYLPARAAYVYAKAFSGARSAGFDWTGLQRGGIRGGTVGEIMSLIGDQDGKPELLAPERYGTRDRIDLWYLKTRETRYRLAKRVFYSTLKTAKALRGHEVMLPVLTLAIRKTPSLRETAVPYLALPRPIAPRLPASRPTAGTVSRNR